jgi:hypothetical protein
MVLIAVLPACRVVSTGVSLEFGIDLTPTLVRLEPERGAGAIYRPGEAVRFIVSVNQPGYVVLMAVDEDGRGYEFDRFFLNGGSFTLPLPGSAYQYTLVPPLGLQRVRAIFTDTPHPAAIRFQGIYRGDAWNRQTTLYIESSRARIRDISETFFYIR